MAAIELAPIVGLVAACVALAVSRATAYRRLDAVATCAPPRPPPARALSPQERRAVLDVMNSSRFVDTAPAEIFATLLDEGIYLCSTRTMYRILADAHEVRERRNQLRHPDYKKPELLATGPNQVWTWDITKLLGPEKWSYFYLYVILDVFSRYVVGWLLADKENAYLAKRLIRETYIKEDIAPGQLTIHGDRGAPMTSRTLAQMMADLTVTKSHSRPQVSNDNPFSESQFKTMKYQPEFPDRFEDISAARVHCREFFQWYNEEHRHSGIAFMTPTDVHHGRVAEVIEMRQEALSGAFQAHPERFVRRPPVAKRPPTAVHINPPKPTDDTQANLRSTCNTTCNEVQPGLQSDSTSPTDLTRQEPNGARSEVGGFVQAKLHEARQVLSTLPQASLHSTPGRAAMTPRPEAEQPGWPELGVTH